MDKDQKKTESRREFLKTAGKFAVYTPPALMLMSKANANYVKETTNGCDSYCDGHENEGGSGSGSYVSGGGWLQDLLNKLRYYL